MATGMMLHSQPICRYEALIGSYFSWIDSFEDMPELGFAVSLLPHMWRRFSNSLFDNLPMPMLFLTLSTEPLSSPLAPTVVS